jgi:hypothetical protein
MLPIRRVVLFKHGVGFFEREAEVDGDESIELHSSYRFRVRVPARGKLELSVSERGAQREEFALSNLNREAIEIWIKNRTIDPATVSALSGITELNDRIANLDANTQQRERDLAAIHENQARLRENLQALGSGQDERRLRERYVAELSEQEEMLREPFGMLAEIRNQRALADAELRHQVAMLELETHA